jgi:Na+/melibiose symporter-like transporter
LGQVAEGLKNFGFNLFVLFYYNTVLGLSGSLCGLAIAIALIFDAVSDPLMGSISDNHRSKWGRRHPFMVAAALPLAVSFFCLFGPPAELGSTGLFLWLTGFAVVTRLMMTVYHVPHIALGAELTANFAERTRVVATRQIFGYLAAFVMAAVAFEYFFSDERGGRMNPEAYAPFAFFMSVAMVITILASAWWTRDQIPFLPTSRAESLESTVLLRVIAEARSAFGNELFRNLFTGVLILYVLVGTETALALYAYEFFWSLSSREILLLSLVYRAGLVSGALFTARLHGIWEKSPTLIFGTVGWSVCQIFPIVGRLVDVVPENGTTELIAFLVVVRFLQGALVQQGYASFSSMMGDIADEHELATGRRQEGIFFGVVSFSGKAASGVGSFIAGVALDLISWPAGLGVATEEIALPAETIRNLGIIYGPLLAVFAVSGPFAYRGYALDRERHRSVLETLAVRPES